VRLVEKSNDKNDKFEEKDPHPHLKNHCYMNQTASPWLSEENAVNAPEVPMLHCNDSLSTCKGTRAPCMMTT